MLFPQWWCCHDGLPMSPGCKVLAATYVASPPNIASCLTFSRNEGRASIWHPLGHHSGRTVALSVGVTFLEKQKLWLHPESVLKGLLTWLKSVGELMSPGTDSGDRRRPRRKNFSFLLLLLTFLKYCGFMWPFWGCFVSLNQLPLLSKSGKSTHMPSSTCFPPFPVSFSFFLVHF